MGARVDLESYAGSAWATTGPSAPLDRTCDAAPNSNAEAEARYDAAGVEPGEPAARDLVDRLTVISDAGMTDVLRPEALAAIARPDEVITIDESTASTWEDRKRLEELAAEYGGHPIDQH